ncbi:MAG: hypothetical protein PVF15_03600 [Candidatus Bathyarchaeota archaeon]|jgi:hypothetical protein
MKNICNRCGRKTEKTQFTFSEVDREEKKYRFGTLCSDCTIEVLDKLKGKVEWFHVEKAWKGYINPVARRELENIGFIHPKRNSQYVEITPIERRRKVERSDALAILRVKYTGGLISKEEYEKRLEEL